MTDDRKKDHIELALSSQTTKLETSLNYEPLFSPHPVKGTTSEFDFIGTKFLHPLWVSSMTGGTERAYEINKNLATIASEFGFGMGLGSCRSLLDSDDRIKDFDFKDILEDYPLYINLGIAQLEDLVLTNSTSKIERLIVKLRADGLIIHVNPMQEWFQPEGDRYRESPIKTIESIIERVQTNIIVKEVGQGFGPKSLESLIKLPIKAIELSGFGGTNFTLLEATRHSARHNAQEIDKDSSINRLIYSGNTTSQMIEWINEILDREDKLVKCREFIISGGIKCMLDGFSLQQGLKAKSVVGMASGLLKYAHDQSLLRDFVKSELGCYEFAKSYLN